LGVTPLYFTASLDEAFITGLGVPAFNIVEGTDGRATLRYQE
jgi:hypothetical protein